MKRYAPLLALTALLFASLACEQIAQATQLAEEEQPINPSPQTEPTSASSELPSTNVDPDFPFQVGDGGAAAGEVPMHPEAENIIVTSEIIMFEVAMSSQEGADYYISELTAGGYTEVKPVTVITDQFFSLAFEGHPSGKEVILESVDQGNGTITISIRLEEIQ